MRTKSSRFEMDMCSGPLVGKIITFTLPLMFSSILQLLYNAVGLVVVGRHSGESALAAVGSTGSLISLIINLLIGLSVGTSVVIARFYGARDMGGASRAAHTAVTVSLLGGVIFGVIGFSLARPLLVLMGTPENVLDLAALYMRIMFIGMPFNMLYNFGAAILRAVGDTKRPLYFLIISGLLNVLLSLLFVVVFEMSVGGVALATIISQGVSALLVLICLMRSEGYCHISLRELRIHGPELWLITKIGLPAGLQGCIFAISNVLIQSSINSFGSLTVAGNTAAANIEGFIYAAMNAVYQAALTFAGQNCGAKQYRRLGAVLRDCQIIVCVIGVTLGAIAFIFAEPLLGIYTKDPDVVALGKIRMSVICTMYFLCGMMDVMVGQLRGIGYSVTPMIVSVLGACGLRILLIYTIFAADHTLRTLYISYPISWFVTAAAHFCCYLIVRRKLPKDNAPLAPARIQEPSA